EIANANSVVALERHARMNRLIVDGGPVPAEHVLNEPFVLHAQQTGVLPANRGRRDGNVAVRTTAEDDDVLFEPQAMAGIGAFADQQMRHRTTSALMTGSPGPLVLRQVSLDGSSTAAASRERVR